MSEQDSNNDGGGIKCVVKGFDFVVEIGMNGSYKKDAKYQLNRIMPDIPWHITECATEQYIKRRMNEAGKLMGENTGNGSLYEYHKGQFLAFREIMYPDTYGKDVKVDKSGKEKVKDE